MDGAGAALRDTAAEFGPFESEEIADDPKQGHVGLSIHLNRFIVNGERVDSHREEFTINILQFVLILSHSIIR
jgi:hypothetical protein